MYHTFVCHEKRKEARVALAIEFVLTDSVLTKDLKAPKRAVIRTKVSRWSTRIQICFYLTIFIAELFSL